MFPLAASLGQAQVLFRSPARRFAAAQELVAEDCLSGVLPGAGFPAQGPVLRESAQFGPVPLASLRPAQEREVFPVQARALRLQAVRPVKQEQPSVVL